MTHATHGRINGKTIELDDDLGVPNGQRPKVCKIPKYGRMNNTSEIRIFLHWPLTTGLNRNSKLVSGSNPDLRLPVHRWGTDRLRPAEAGWCVCGTTWPPHG